MNFKSLLFKDEPNEAPASAVSPEPAEATSFLRTRTPSAVVSTGRSFAETPEHADSEFTTELTTVLSRGKLPGYSEYLDQMEMLRDVIADETTRSTKALQILEKTLKLPVVAIVESVQERYRLLEAEGTNFTNGLTEETKNTIEAAEKTARDADTALAKYRAQITELENSARRCETDRQNALNSIEVVKNQSEKVRARFMSAYQPQLATLQALLAKLKERS